jgi:hypothetical protein
MVRLDFCCNDPVVRPFGLLRSQPVCPLV